ncbi:Nuclear ribonuclease Z [Platanthera zijinensis]|uniref:Nuclear ribonuclease Z n=1 Tax=Platanthera zijinensis TaxID=2320716 RepID=A0AAP0BT08_9ASPA
MRKQSTTENVDFFDKSSSAKRSVGLLVEGYPVEGLSIGGQETCVIFPSLRMAFDIGRCPQRAISQHYLFISHGHLDHIGGLPMYVATRGLYGMNPPTIFVPVSIKESVERLFNVHREMDRSELKHKLIGMNVGDEFQIRKDLKVKAFRTYHVIPSLGYIIYSVKQKLKQEYATLSGNEIKELRFSGVEVTHTMTSPEIAFTGDTTSDFIVDPDNTDVLKARILVMESTFVDNAMSIEHAREYGHTHLSEISSHADKFQNKALLLIHFSARYTSKEVESAIANMPATLADRTYALLEGL